METTASPDGVPENPRAALLLGAAALVFTLPMALLDPKYLIGFGWPAWGLAVASLLLAPRGLWLPLLSAFAVATAVVGLVLASLLPGLFLLVATAFQFALAHRLFTRYVGYRSLERGGVLGRLLMVVAVLLAVNLVLAMVTYLLTDVAGPVTTSLALSLSHILGVALIVPQVLAEPEATTPRRRLVVLQVVAATAVVGLLAIPTRLPSQIVLLFPLMLWLALTCSFHRLLRFLVAISVALLAMTVLDVGSIAYATRALPILPGQVLVLVAAVLSALVMTAIPLSLTLFWYRDAGLRAEDRSERLERIIQAATGVALVTQSLDSAITRFSPGAERLIGYSEAEVIGRSPAIYLVEGEVERLAAMLRTEPAGRPIVEKMLARAATESYELEVRRKDGVRRTMSFTVTPILDHQGRPVELLATGEDVTERRETEHALRDALRSERAAATRLGEADLFTHELVSTVNHELRTPITTVTGFAEMLLDSTDDPLSDVQRWMLESISRNGDRLHRLVDNLLTLSDLDEGGVPLEPVDVDVDALVRDVVGDLGAGPERLEVRVEIGSDGSAGRLKGAPDQLHRVLTNVLSNAVKFSPDGGRVVVGASGDDRTVSISVRDEGIGIAEADQAELFGRFFRSADAAERHIPGTGLGLYVSQALVVGHGGHIEVESVLGEGSTFTVRLPRAPA